MAAVAGYGLIVGLTHVLLGAVHVAAIHRFVAVRAVSAFVISAAASRADSTEASTPGVWAEQ